MFKSLLEVNIFSAITNFFSDFGKAVGLNWITIVAFSLAVILLVVSFFRSEFSIELRINRAVNKINAYLENKPLINDENLVEFNKIMKAIPRPMRYQWQKYMLNRNNKPSTYLSEKNCVEKPRETSSYKHIIQQTKSISFILCIFTFVLSIGALVGSVGSLADIIIQSAITPLLILFVTEIICLFLKARLNAVVSDLYYNFKHFEKKLDKAVETLPNFVDYEILFTRKEIVNNIPALQEYLEQRALYEEEQIRLAREAEVEHENYDFSSLGVNGALVMERAMKEAEYYLGNRRRYLAEIEQFQNQKDVASKNYDEKNKTSQRKLRDIKEALDRLKEKLNTVTSVLLAEDIRRQQTNEITKQQAVEKEIEEDRNRYEGEVRKLDDEIEKRKQSIEEGRIYCEKVLNGEFKEYADKIYNKLSELTKQEVVEEINTLKQDKMGLQSELEDREKYIAEKNVLYEEKLALLEELYEKIDNYEKLNSGKEDIVSMYQQQIDDLKADLELSSQVLDTRKAENEKLVEENEYLKSLLRAQQEQEFKKELNLVENEFYVDNEGNSYYINENGERVYYTPTHVDDEQNESQTQEEKIETNEVIEEELKALQEKIDEEDQKLQAETEKLINQIDEANMVANTEPAKKVKKQKPVSYEIDTYTDKDIVEFNNKLQELLNRDED